ncbi:ABC transporter domain-containing protein [Hyphomicrobiales bacterium]|nr:ABC transporter domain-containing protein [Hyphomicrobiales bacterium]CAH1677325.1 ABC transporter domain-containing protein [Hyphomicrobiales bacterium]
MSSAIQQSASQRRPDAIRTDLAFRCRSLSVDLGAGGARRRIIAGLNLDVSKNQFVCILGESGVGKTTLLRVFGGLVPAAEGGIELNGEPVSGPPKGAVFVFQNYAASLLPWRTACTNVELGLEASVPKKERRARALAALETVNLSKHAHDYPRQLSGGMQQRVQIARALALDPQLLLMDEPFGALDAMTRENLQVELRRIQQASGATIIFITHDVDEAVFLADRLVVLKGRPASIGLDVVSDLPPDRDQIKTKESPAYLKLRHAVYEMLRGPGAAS